MNETGRLIDLCGYTKSILFKNEFILVVLFADDYFGNVVITVPFECIQYHTRLERNKRYHFQAELIGKTKVLPNGKSFTNNALYVKRILS